MPYQPVTATPDTAVDMDNLWLPFTPNRDFKAHARMFTRAEGLYFFGPDDAPILDGSSGLFTTPAGHARAELARAAHDQILELDFTSSFLRGHPKSFLLAQELAGLMPASLNRFFFTSSGSEAIDTAIKIAGLYHRVRKQATRTVLVSRERAYHGSNVTGVALSGITGNRRSFPTPMLPVVHMRHTWSEHDRFTPGQPSTGAELADDLLRLIQLHGAENIAACFVEPVAGSTGVLVPPVGYLERLRDICTEHGVLLVFDDVICGFGRLGAAFSSQAFGVTPDIVTMAKAITNGVIPMGAVAVRQEIYDTITSSQSANAIELFHGYTSSAHPVACATSLATLALYRDEALFDRAAAIAPYFHKRLFSLEGIAGITDIRAFGLLAGIDINPDIAGFDGYGFQKRLYDRGLHIKTTGNSAVIAPPFQISHDQIEFLIATLRETLLTRD